MKQNVSRMNLEVMNELMSLIRGHKSVYAIYRKSVAGLYKSYRKGLIEGVDYKRGYDEIIWKCALMLG